ncbi:MAG: hypothetical protein ACTSRZ_00280 [Promethearchaeota archaeon]
MKYLRYKSQNDLKEFNKIPVNNWLEYLRKIEKLYFIGEYNYAFQDCEKLLNSIIGVLSKKVSNFIENNLLDSRDLIFISNDLKEIFHELNRLKSQIRTNEISEKIIENYIANLKKIFLIIKISKKNIKKKTNINSINDSINKQTLDFSSNIKGSEKNNKEDIWKILKYKLMEFENKHNDN